MIVHVLSLIVITFVYAMLVLLVIRFSDVEKMEAFKTLLLAFVFGFAAAIVAASIESLIAFLGVAVTSIFMVIIVAPIAEEYAKLYMSTSRYFIEEMDEPEDALIYAACVALGFAFIENVLYIVTFSLELSYVQLVDLTIQRMFLCIPIHIAATSIGITVYIYLREIYDYNHIEALVLAVASAAPLHAAYNLMAITGSLTMASIIVILSIVAITFAWLMLRSMKPTYKLPLPHHKNLY
ncbi:MAG: hypothetical protein DRO23_08845 [Thermoprotei archaeon]|nr:MAG: hypothetical protein DRO23_08845 [Thermoprotei archaeon]